MVVLDTCALIELCKDSPGFSKQTYRRIDGGAYVLSVSFAEIACKVKRGRLALGLTTEELYRQVASIPSIEIVAIGAEEWLDSIGLDWPGNNDPADRLITAFAIKRKLSVVTTDLKIKRYYKRVIW